MARTGGCSCGKVSYALEGDPSRVGVCHYELWIWRREKWLHPIEGARQFQRDREP